MKITSMEENAFPGSCSSWTSHISANILLISQPTCLPVIAIHEDANEIQIRKMFAQIERNKKTFAKRNLIDE